MSDEFLASLEVSAKLYKKYQMTIHNDPPGECNESSFFHFHVKNPLQVLVEIIYLLQIMYDIIATVFSLYAQLLFKCLITFDEEDI